MEIKLLHKVAILVAVICFCKAQPDPKSTTDTTAQTTIQDSTNTPQPVLEEVFISLDDDFQERKLTLKGNTKYNVDIVGECLNYQLSVAVLDAKCSANEIQISFTDNERINKNWTCGNVSKTKRVYDSGANTLTIEVPTGLKNNQIVLLISAYFIPSVNNDKCPNVPDNYFKCINCKSVENNGEDIRGSRFIHKDLQCNGRRNCDQCDTSYNDENNDVCPLSCSEDYWTGFHDTQYMLTILLAGLFFIMSPIVLVMVLFYNRKMSPAARERARARESNDPGRYSRTVQPPPTYEDVHDIKEPPPTFHEVVLDSLEEVTPSRTNNNNM